MFIKKNHLFFSKKGILYVQVEGEGRTEEDVEYRVVV